MTTAPTREELERMLKQCVEHPEGNVRNPMVADLIHHYLDLLDDRDRLVNAIIPK